LGLIILAIIIFILPYILESVDHIDYKGKYELYLYVLLVLVMIHLYFLVDKTEIIDEKLTKSYNVSNYHEYSTYIIDKIQTTTKKEARLIEYSTASIKEILVALDKKEFAVKLLIQNPDNAINGFQKRKIWTAICDLHIYHKNRETFEVKCYENTASLRGRHIGETISIGQYIYPIEKNSKEEKFNTIVGHANPMVSFEEYSHEGKILLEFFNDHFDKLWESAESIKDVCNRCEAKYKKTCPIAKNYT